jgi:hypothetical protein
MMPSAQTQRGQCVVLGPGEGAEELTFDQTCEPWSHEEVWPT